MLSTVERLRIKERNRDNRDVDDLLRMIEKLLEELETSATPVYLQDLAEAAR